MRNVVGLFSTRGAAERLIERLKNSGVAADAISVAMKDDRDSSDPDPTPTLSESSGVGELSTEGTAVGAVSGAAVGTLVGLLVAGSSIALPGLGTILVAGPVVSTLTGASVGAASGGLVGALFGSGLTAEEAEPYLAAVDAGHVIVVARVPHDAAVDVLTAFQDEGATRTHTIEVAD